jgi:hypothetical protein
VYYSELDEAGAPTATAKAHPGELTSYDEETAPYIGVGGALPEGKESIHIQGNGCMRRSALYATGLGQRSSSECAHSCLFPCTACDVFVSGARCQSCLHLCPPPRSRLDSWHRGTPVRARALRLNHHIIWRTRAAEWIQWQAFSMTLSKLPGRFLERCSMLNSAVQYQTRYPVID